MIMLTLKEYQARERVCLALDFSCVSEAMNLVFNLSDYTGMFKIGKELHIAAAETEYPLIERVYLNSNNLQGNKERKANIFLDLKLHDTPNTVYKSAIASTVPGVYIIDVHLAGGEEMCKKALEGVREAAFKKNIPAPKVVGVTVLTSLSDKDLEKQGLGISYEDLVKKRTELAREWGLDGIVCPANKAGGLEKKFGKWLYVTTGIRYENDHGSGQEQLYTAEQAVKDCSSSILVIGSAITKAQNKKERALDILKAMAKEL
ncbi:MAG: orotidine-5'-phosphate decarboxylase [Nanoarchaeota archaeon]|nr:orotidine-5'-phosphate decarboxylase [Nanoarchaeota archaeon]MBU1643577.1 orotidine-5'-phosphate decarboxylase [Nanoarchaeota archaeon]MBU1977173.1 orotidine-5'-phosphate decarboxylase [Nanoarchaeota archaeon]